ncbi:hypothetical protein D9758_008956 [Tetrapyrgos nigripes]|uniref:DUF6534 domain-containing protein n=1 Tax=Tetrapyrgos nigripes TaxID=182062 RepID=A0A8H5GKU0_9AGAR|nr:hypothetical protein D9758_008956 [Tetrapyrgos nigripes]
MTEDSAAPPLTLPPDFVATSGGPLFVTNAINWLFMGILIQQVFNYQKNFPNDMSYIKLLVAVLFALEIVHWIIVTMDTWYYLIEISGHPEGFFIVPWEAAAIVILTGIVSLIVQSFYIVQIWWISRERFVLPIVALIGLISLGQSVMALAGGSRVLKVRTLETVAENRSFFPGSFVADTLIALTMSWILYMNKKWVWFRKTETLLNRLILNTIRTGCLTSIIAGVTLALFDIFPNLTYYGTPANCLQKLYTLSLVANINGRQAFQSHEETEAHSFSDIRFLQQTHVSDGEHPNDTRFPAASEILQGNDLQPPDNP